LCFEFRNDTNLAIFLEYDKDLNVRGKNKKEKLVGFFSSFQKTGDELLVSLPFMIEGPMLRVFNFFRRKKWRFLLKTKLNLKKWA
jgi:hypothetical protein